MRSCPLCNAHVAGDLESHTCARNAPSSGTTSAAVAARPRGRRVDRLSETLAFKPEESEDGEGRVDDGFPGDRALIGETLGHYRLEKEVGRGSMGRVYRAVHLGLHRHSAVKVMNPGLVARQPQVRERFWAEARAVANLLHPHVVTIHNLGSDRGYHFIEMEYIHGGVSLREEIVKLGALDPIRATTLIRQVALALDAAHRSGLVHRDVKPANVLLTREGNAKLADFGLVKKIGDADGSRVAVAGTPTYMAPELFDGVPSSHRSDLYAVGVMYYYLLTARLPFSSDQISKLILRHRGEPVPDVRSLARGLPDAVQDIIERCMAKRPEGRFESAAEAAEALGGVVHQLRDTESLIRESVEGINCFVQGARDRFRIVFHLPTERLQEVYIEGNTGPGGERLISVFSVCAPADSRHFEFALRLNDRLSYGSLSLRNVNGEPMFVMTRTFPRDHVCAMDIRAALLEIARRSDVVEQQLTNADLF